ncbi:MAG: complex I subunit 5 family protein [Candidatus Competibacteraceae bacterium]|jgi:formate hydrogenlyase subunit 3/multisubunit Na+/H+ antiporter MnhD subunit|nr:complex I subunit 5 family protein [Candidatus Competibacteraceae bacterium]
MSYLLLFSLALPLLLVFAIGFSRLRSAAMALIPIATLLPLPLAVTPDIAINLPWLILGTRLGIDPVSTPFLALVSVLWTAAGLYAKAYLAQDPERTRFYAFFLLTFTGNLGLVLAFDAVSFYLFFALMSFAAYGLIVHDGSSEARRAGRVYLTMAVIGEACLLSALLLIGSQSGNVDLREWGPQLADSPTRGWIIALVLAGFGIKMGAVPLHIWLPLAHPCAPTPASAVLSGIIIKAGLIGWMRFLPVGDLTLPGWGMLCLAVGMGSAFFGAFVGVFQERAKTVLAYSSISQMGLITALLGIALAIPDVWPMLLIVILLFSVHHGLAKGALFLGVGISTTGPRWTGWALALPALVLVGAPLTSGALIKPFFKEAALNAPGNWSQWMPWLLTLSSIATGLLMVRFLVLAWPRTPQSRFSLALGIPWITLLVMILLLPIWIENFYPGLMMNSLKTEALLSAGLVLAATGLVSGIAWGVWLKTGFRLRIPEGDLLIFLKWLADKLRFGESQQESSAIDVKPSDKLLSSNMAV